jgi:hypothetical protein
LVCNGARIRIRRVLHSTHYRTRNDIRPGACAAQGTCANVSWINPVQFPLTSIMPMIVNDTTDLQSTISLTPIPQTFILIPIPPYFFRLHFIAD